METDPSITALIEAIPTMIGFLGLMCLILFQFVMFLLLPFFVYRIRAEVIKIREQIMLTPDPNIIELTDVVKTGTK